MLDAQKLQELKSQGKLSDEKFESERHRLANKILHKEGQPSSKSAIIYIILAFWFGTIGIHNFYAGYWKRGSLQFLLTLISPYMLFIPLLFTAVWALLELLFVNHSAKGVPFHGDKRWVIGLKGLTVLAIIWFASVSDTVLQQVDIDALRGTGEDITQMINFNEVEKNAEEIMQQY